MMKKNLQKKNVQSAMSWIKFIGPVFIVYTLFYAYPLVKGVYYSFTNWSGIESSASFIGLKNYVDLFYNDPYFLPSIGKTLLFTVWNVILTNFFAMLFALGLTTRFRFNRLIRTAIFLPNMISMVVAGFIWLFMFTKMSPLMYESLGLEFLSRSWLGNPEIVIQSIVLVSLWHGVGYVMTIYIAALNGLDENIIEAASIDGANDRQIFWKVKMPSMLPMVGVGLFINISGSLKIFDIVMSLTAGGPGRASEVAMLNIYREAFVNNNMGYGSAKATILSLMIILVAIIQFRVTSEREV